MKRNPWLRIAMTASGMLIVILIAASWRFLVSRGVFTSVEPRAPGQCRMVAAGISVSDIAVDPAGKTAYLTSVKGGLYAYEDDAAGGRPVRLSGAPKDFHPIAASLFRAPDSAVYLRVIFRHEDSTFAISLFRVNRERVEELGRLTADVLTDPADLVSLDPGRFYLVNRHTTHTALGRWLDDTFILPRAEVLYYDGMKFVTVAKRLNSPDSVALSPDGSHLFVAEDYPRTLVNFARNEFTGGLEDSTVLPIASEPRKISVAPDGSLIVAARPKAGMGQVWRVKGENVELLYARRNGEIAAAAELGRHLLIGGSDGLTDCSF
jgi:arylesterase / paraoxonase